MGILDGKVAVVTGAGRGLGRGMALHLAREGACVVVNDLGGSVNGQGRDDSVAGQVVDEIKAGGGEAVANADTVASWEGGHSILQTALDHYGRVDILINNAGILRDQFLWHMSEEEWDAVLDVHLGGAFLCTRAVAPFMKKQGWGRILFITSTAGFIGTFGQCNYGAGKMGMVGLSRSLALEMEGCNVTSNCIAPFAWTRIPASIHAVTEEIREAVDRLFKEMEPADVSPLVVYLASERAAGITGQVFGVRGKEIYTFNQSRVVRSMHKAEGWRARDFTDVLEPTFRQHLTPLDNSMTYFGWDALL